MKFRHRLALWFGPRLMVRGLKARGVDARNVVTKADLLRRASRG